jgi:WD40 repeat protein
MAVFPANSFRRFDQSLNLVKGHHGTVTDVQFSPFAQNLLASSSEDATVKFWVCPQEGYKENCNESDATLKGHVKKVLGIQWHKNAEGVIASHAADSTVRVWDVENLKSKIIHPDLPNFATAMQWSPKGDQLGVIVKGGELRIFDPRIPESVQKVRVHEGPRACKFGYIEDGKLITGGSNKMAEREYAIWDTRALDKKIVGGPLGTGLGVGHIYVDQQHKLIYCAGRGES